MKDKEMIEEMAKIMCENDCEECRRESIEFYGNSYDEDTQCVFSVGAEKLYNQGYRKVKDSVVLSREEYENLLREKDELLNDRFAVCHALREQAKQLENKEKETAEKIIDIIKTFCPDKKFVEIIKRIIAERLGVDLGE